MGNETENYTAGILHRQFLRESPSKSRPYSAFSDFEFLSGVIHVMLSLMERYEEKIDFLEKKVERLEAWKEDMETY